VRIKNLKIEEKKRLKINEEIQDLKERKDKSENRKDLVKREEISKKRIGITLLIGADADRILLARIFFGEEWFWKYGSLEPTRSWKVLKQSR
jgi:hypothetical protein